MNYRAEYELKDGLTVVIQYRQEGIFDIFRQTPYRHTGHLNFDECKQEGITVTINEYPIWDKESRTYLSLDPEVSFVPYLEELIGIILANPEWVEAMAKWKKNALKRLESRIPQLENELELAKRRETNLKGCNWF